MENTKSIWDGFTKKYSLSKTLRFELRPVGKTLEFIKKKGLIEEDKEREKEFNKVKDIMDESYKDFIEICLSKIRIEAKDIEAYRKAYEDLKKDPKNQKLKEQYAKNQNILRKQIHQKIKEVDNFNKLFAKEFINKVLPEWLESNDRQQDKELVLKFGKWVTYFTGFFDNRKNVFSEKEISTSIIYRIVHDNLPKFLDNVSKFEELKKIPEFNYEEVEKSFKKELSGKTLDEFTSLGNFNNCLNQSGIDKFNLIVGGKTEENNVSIKGINQLVNELSQKQDDKTRQRNMRKLKLTPLFKQILSDRESASFVLEPFKDKKEVFEKIDEFYSLFNDLSKNLKSSIEKLKECDLEKIYVKNDNRLTKISKDMFDDWNKIHEGLKEYLKLESQKNGRTEKQSIKEAEQKIKSKYFSVQEIKNGISILELENKQSIVDYFLGFKRDNASDSDLFAEIKNKFSEFCKIDRDSSNKLTEEASEKDVETIKEFLDSIMNLYHFVRPLQLHYKRTDYDKGNDALETDADFYNDFNDVFDKLGQIIPLYNKVRNYVTQKSFSTKKFKLNFNNSTLAGGWDLNKEKDNYAIILRRLNPKINTYDYYLGIMSGTDKKIFDADVIPSNSDSIENSYEKMNYKLLPGPDKMLPKVFFSNKNKDFFSPSNEILDIRKRSSHTKNGNPQEGFEKREFNLDDCHKIIEFYKSSLQKHEDWSVFKFNLKETNQYTDLSEFYADVANQGYKISYINLDENYIAQLVDEGKLYLFQIWNKDFSEYSKGKPNLHTIYWRELFSEENLKDVVYKLNGEAELFFREASIKRGITHPKNKAIPNKNPIKEKETSIFDYDIIKDKRYTKDKFFFHCPITLNFKAKDQSKVIHKLVNKFIHDTKEQINVLGIDRGERNLAYYTWIDSKGNILEQSSFNIISDDLQRKLDYQDKLDQIEGDRDKARKNWKKIANIKEMKTGYLSQVIHKISKLAIKHNAIIVLEDLNFGFKRGRFKIEKQIYQKFEKMLIDKLNHLVFKDADKTIVGGSLKAYQLTNKFESFKKLGKQSGIIYYVDAYKTSKICPKTGFVNLLYLKFENIKNSQEFFKKFKYIKYVKEDDLFEFNFNYSDFFSDTNKNNLTQNNWSIWSNGIKLTNKRNKKKNNNWETIEVNVTKDLQNLFGVHNINYESNEDLTGDISKVDDKTFFESLTYLLKTILQLRNSYSDYEVKELKNKSGDSFKERDYDYILSCVKDSKGEFFDSRQAQKNEIADADANGAYHIALKGLMLIDKIKKSDVNEKVDLKIDRNDFMNYVLKQGDTHEE